MSLHEHIAIGFLAGGQARRMGGGDKAFIEVGGQTILRRQLHITDEFSVRLINANGDPARFAEAGLPVVPDTISGFLGPLIGLLSCLEYLHQHHPEIAFVQTMATDAPFIPHDLTARLFDALDDGAYQLAQPMSCGRRHPVFGLWPVGIRQELYDAVVTQDIRKIDDFTAGYKMAVVTCEHAEYDPFMNLNRAEDVAQAEQINTTVHSA